jgi:hypothetical protein
MNNYENGEIWGWNGGECPVHPESEVMVWFRDGGWTTNRAGQLRWGHIVCFKVTKAHAEPKTIWVNEWGSGWGYSYTTEEEAKTHAGPWHIRIAVEYVEKQK